MYFLLVLNLLIVSAQDRPKIESQNGNLILTAGKNKDVKIETTGRLFINQEDVVAMVKSIRETLNNFNKGDKPVVLQNFEQIMNGVTQRLETIEKTSNLTEFPQIITLQKLTKRRLDFYQRKLRKLTVLLNKDECASNPCSNGGTCQDMYNAFICQCLDGWEGPRCETDVNECYGYSTTELGCQNGATCVNKPGTYECTCADGWFGIHCTRRSQDCSFSTDICVHGTCVPQTTGVGFKCICDQGWKSDGTRPACTVDVNECEDYRPPCSSNPPVTCINLPGTFHCGHCPIGFTGNGFYCSDIDECALFNGGCSMNPMVQCINTPGSRMCGLCPPGYLGNGMICAYQGGVCGVNNGGCHPVAQCRDNSRISSTYVECICPAGYSGNGIGPSGCLKGATDLCNPNPCIHGDCTIQNNDIVCNCNRKYTGRLCDIRKSPCDPNPCQNGGTCHTVAFSYICNCSNSYTGVNCENERQGCGKLEGPTGTLVYPLPNGTLTTREKSCAWSIQTTPEKILNITFQTFNFPRCNGRNFLQINDGKNAAAQLIGRFCGTTLPKGGNFLTTTHVLYIWIRHDAITPRPRFELTWNQNDPICGGDVNITTHGSFNSPGAPGSYPPNRDCYWRFKAPFGKRIQFHFFSLDIGNNTDCSKDYLEFFSGLEPSDPLLTKYCNTHLPEPLFSTGNEVLAHFHSGKGSSHLGFRITYSLADGMPGCGGIYTRNQGVITLPTIDGSYPPNTLCEYKIQLPEISKVKIIFTQIDIEDSENCRNDYVAVHIGASTDSLLYGRYCGSIIPAPIIMYSSVFLIIFNSDKYLGKTGFQIRYEVLCGGKFTERNRVIESPSYLKPETGQSRKECIYEIIQPPGFTIVLNITDISIGNASQSCVYGYLEIRDGNEEDSTLIGKYCDKAPIIYSTYNILRLRYVVFFGTVDGFKLQYTAISNYGCGAILTAKTGSIESPPDLHSYTNGLNCTWFIKAPPENAIQITWVKFLLEDSDNCIYDRVTVIDNATTPGSEVGVYCGNKMPPTLVSSGNLLTVTLKIDSNINYDGFLFTYTFIHQRNVCGGRYFTSSGVLKSPYYPENYPTNRDCTWIITVPPGQKIMLNVTHFDIESFINCRYDYVEIRNGGTAASPLIGKYCGKDILKLIPSHANQMYIRFKSDMTKTASGFSINWDSVTTGCGGTLTAPSGTIISPHYPEPYSKNAMCEWKISISEGSILQIVFADLELESHTTCILDYIEIFDGIGPLAKSLGKFCKLGNVPAYIRSTTNSMTLKFRSDMSFQGRGFQLQYSTLCITNLKGYQGVIESPNFPNNYPHKQNCIWDVEVTRGNKINITFSHFQLERSMKLFGKNCSYDYLEIAYKDLEDEPTPTYLTYATYCGLKVPEDINLNSNAAQIRFVTDNYFVGAGFRLEWRIDGCGGVLSHPTGTIQTPNYPTAYPVSTNCEWLIQTDYGQSIEITFKKLDLEHSNDCDYDSISIYAGSDDTYPLQTKFCHVGSKPLIVTSNGNQMFVTFESDMSYNGQGFSADYQTVPSKCGGKMRGNSGTIHTPNYPKNFDKNDTCIWEIEVQENHNIHLKFKDLDFYRVCLKNYIRIFDGPTQAYPMLATLCGNKTPNETIISSGSHMTIEMVTHMIYATKGFLAEYSMGCGARITTQSSGLIDFSQTTLISTELNNCSWTIESVRPDEHIFLTFTYLTTYYCYDDNTTGINVYDGDNNEAPMIGHYCGSSSPPMLRSTGSKLHIEVLGTDNHMTARYSVVDTECGGTLESAEGYFATPNFPNNYPVDVQCEWTLQASPGSKVTVQFSDFQISKSGNCNEDYLEIREVNSTGKSVGVFCGDEFPTNITVANSLWLFFRSDKPIIGGDSSTAKGFKAEYSITHGNTLYGVRGLIASPLYPRIYYNNYELNEFNWKILVKPLHQISIKFLDFDVDFSYHGCQTTYLEIFDGADENAPQLGTFCGSEAPDNITTTSNVAFIKMNYAVVRKASKFLLEWQQVRNLPTKINITQPTIPGCGSGDTIFIEENTRYNFSSPNYPGTYPRLLTCTWTFSTRKGMHLSIFFPVIDVVTIVPCILSDSITIYSGIRGTTNFKFVSTVCKDNTTMTFKSDTNLMKVTFKSISQSTFTSFRNKMGFLGYVESVCGGYMDAPNGVIEITNNTRRHRKNMLYNECEWLVTVRAGRTIKVEFVYLQLGVIGQLEEKCNTYLMLKNGQYPDSPLLGAGKFCHNGTPAALETSGNSLFVKFESYESHEPTYQFKLKYSEVSINCGGEIELTEVNNSTIISSPNYPNVPTPHSECIWRIVAPAGETIRLDFQERFDLIGKDSCKVEGVEIRDGGTGSSSLIGTYCKKMPSSQKTLAHMMFIRYYTNEDFPRNGFQAKVSIASCGGIIRASKGSITSPNFNRKKLYPVNMDCNWEIIVPKGHNVELNFQALDLPYSITKTCSSDYVILSEYNIINQTENKIGKYCGSSPLTGITSSSNQVYVHFKTGSVSRQFNGFKIHFNASRIECGGELNTDFGTFTSPGYPLMRYSSLCRWRIKVAKGRRIKVEILDFDMNRAPHSYIPYLGYINGDDERLDETTLWPARISIPKIFRSSDNSMLVILWTRASTNRGFKARYTSDEPTICIGNINEENGTINTPNDTNYRCSWIRSVDNINKTIALMVNANFSRQIFGTCGYSSSLEIHSGNLQSSNLEVEICKNTNGIKIVRSPREKLIFKASSRTKIRLNFTMSYKTYACGGILTDSYGYVISPGYPKQTMDYECSWIVETEMGRSMLIKFIDFDLGDDCDKSYLVIYNGHLLSSPKIGKYCRDSKPSNIQAGSNNIRVEYHVGLNSKGKGFNFTYEPVTQGCGGIYHEPNSVLQTPGYPKPYGDNVECSWEIYCKPGYHIVLSFLDRFQIETSDNCANDYIQVFDNDEDRTNSSSHKYCGREPPFNTHSSSSNQLFVVFRSDARTNGIGFRAKWTLSCGGTFKADETLRYIVSPGYPEGYANKLNCKYDIITTNQYIIVKFEDFELEKGSLSSAMCKYDNLTVIGTGRTKSVTFCGSDPPPPIRQKNKVSFTFMSDNWLMFKGFKLSYQIETCGGNSTQPMFISKTVEKNYYNNDYFRAENSGTCVWNIQAPKNYRVILRVTELNILGMLNCIFEYLSVNDGKLGKFCGQLTADDLPIIHSQNENMSVVLRYTNNRKNNSTLEAVVYFMEGPELGCGGDVIVANGTSKTIEILQNTSSDCIWKFSTGIDSTFKVEFYNNNCSRSNKKYNVTLDTCTCSTYHVRDGLTVQSELIATFCSHQEDSPVTYYTSKGYLFIRIVALVRFTSKIRVTSITGLCGPSILHAGITPKYLTSPNFPLPYPKNVKCVWQIKTLSPRIFSTKLHLKFIDFNLNNELKGVNNSCNDKDRLVINKQNNNLYDRYYGIFRRSGSVSSSTTICRDEDKILEFYSDSNIFYLTFYSNNLEKHGKGFKIEYQQASCNRNYTELSGTIIRNSGMTNCSSYIMVPENYTIALYFDKFIMFRSSCDHNRFQVYDGDETKEKLLEVCRTIKPNPVFSTGNRLYIKNDLASMSAKLVSMYKITYIANNKSRGCGGDIFGLEGTISSPMYPETYAFNSLCTWTITVPFGLNAKITFQIFDVQGDCKENYVAISTYDEDKVNRRVFCNQDNPAPTLTKGKITVDYKTNINNAGTGWLLKFNSEG